MLREAPRQVVFRGDGAGPPGGGSGHAAGRGARALRSPWWAPLALTCLVAAAYGQTARFDLVWEDPAHFLRNPALQSGIGWRVLLTSPTSSFLPQIPGADRMYRPLLAVSGAADRAIWGRDPGGLHLSSALAHLAVVLVVWRLAWRLSGSPGVGLLAGALLGVHPSAVEAVAYLSARMDVLVGLGTAAVLLLLRGSVGPGGGRRLAGALTCLVLALGSKETAMVIPAIATWAAWVHPAWLTAGGPVPPWTGLAARVAPFWAILGAYAMLRQTAIGTLAPVSLQVADIPGQLQRAAVALATYGQMTLIPQPTRGIYSVTPPAGPADGRVLLGVTVVVLLAAILLWLRCRHPGLALALGWYALALVPISNLLPIYYVDVIQVAERSLYPALVGWCLFLALGAHTLHNALRPSGRQSSSLALTAGGLIVGTFLVVTAVKVEAWRDDVTLWRTSLLASPDSFLTRLNLGWALARAGRLQGAQAIVRESKERFPPDPRMASLAGWVADAQGDSHEALRLYDRAIALGATEAPTLRQATVLAARLQEWDRAGNWFGVAAERLPRAAWPQVGLGWYRGRQGREDLAQIHFDRAARLEPRSPERPWLLSQLRASEGRTREAVEASHAALAVDPSFLPARRALALFAEQQGEIREAIGHWQRIAQELPSTRRGEALGHLRRLEAAAGARPPGDPR